MRYFYPQQGVANESLSEGLFTDPSQLRVSRANLSDAGQYGYAGPSPSTSQNYGPGWNGDTWDNSYQFSDHPAMDAAQQSAQRAASGGRRSDPLTDSPMGNSILGTVPGASQLALAARRSLSSQSFTDEDDRYNAFAKQPQFAQMLPPQTAALYELTFGHSPDEERKIRMAKMEAAMKASEFSHLPQKQAFDMNAQVAKDLGVNPEVLMDAIDEQLPGQNPVGHTVHLRPHYAVDPNNFNNDGSPKTIEVPGAPVFVTPRLHRAGLDSRKRTSPYFSQPPTEAPASTATMAPAGTTAGQLPTKTEFSAMPRWQQLAWQAHLEGVTKQQQMERDAANRAASWSGSEDYNQLGSSGGFGF